MMAAVDREFGRVDILVNNVGIGHRARPEALSLDDWRKVVGVNLDGTFLATREAGRRMIARGAGGSIVSISSIAGSSALGRGNFVYSVTKAGIIQLDARAGRRVGALPDPGESRSSRRRS